jgi:hypothetical protein
LGIEPPICIGDRSIGVDLFFRAQLSNALIPASRPKRKAVFHSNIVLRETAWQMIGDSSLPDNFTLDRMVAFSQVGE